MFTDFSLIRILSGNLIMRGTVEGAHILHDLNNEKKKYNGKSVRKETEKERKWEEDRKRHKKTPSENNGKLCGPLGHVTVKNRCDNISHSQAQLRQQCQGCPVIC